MSTESTSSSDNVSALEMVINTPFLQDMILSKLDMRGLVTMLRVSKSAFQSASKHLYREFSFENYKKLGQGCSLEVGDITTVGNLHHYLSHVRILSLSRSSKNIEFSDWTKLFKTFPHASRITKYDQILYRGFVNGKELFTFEHPIRIRISQPSSTTRPKGCSSRTLAHHYGRVEIPIGWQENIVLTILRELDHKRVLDVKCLSFLRLDQDILEIIRLLSRSLLTVSQHPKDRTETVVTFEQMLKLLHWDGLRKLSTVDFGSYRLRPSSRSTDALIPDLSMTLQGSKVAEGGFTHWKFVIHLRRFNFTDSPTKTSKSVEQYARELAEVSRQYVKAEKTSVTLSVKMAYPHEWYRYGPTAQIEKAFEEELSGAELTVVDVES